MVLPDASHLRQGQGGILGGGNKGPRLSPCVQRFLLRLGLCYIILLHHIQLIGAVNFTITH